MIALLLLSLLAGDFFVTGPDLAGRAAVTRTAPGKARVRVTFAGFGKVKGGAVEGEGALDASGRLLGFRGARLGRVRIAGRAVAWTPAPAQPFGILLVPGLSTSHWNRAGIPYFDENLATLRALGFAARRIGLSTEAPVADNAAGIAREIRAEAAAGRRPIVFAHSKGATETIAALALDPGAAALVAGVVLLQPLYAGSPLADLVDRHAALERAVALVFEKALGGSRRAVLDMSFAVRGAFNAAHPYPAARVPTVVVRSTFRRRLSKSLLWVNEKLIRKQLGLANDGMVTPRDAAVPGAARTIDFDDLDHFEPALRNESRHTPVEITTRAMLALMPLVR